MKIDAFSLDADLILRPAPNGGFAVYERGSKREVMDRLIGAYSSSKDMLDALSEALSYDDSSIDSAVIQGAFSSKGFKL